MDLEQAHAIALQTIGSLVVQVQVKDGEIAFLKDQLKTAMEAQAGSVGSENRGSALSKDKPV